MQRLRSCGLWLIAALSIGCAVRVSLPLPPGEDYVFPSWAPGEVRGDEGRRIREAWSAVLAGQPARAHGHLQKVLRGHPGLVPAETGMAYALLRSGRVADALRAFDGVLARRPDYVPALVGAGSVALRRGDPEAALLYYRRAEAGAPADPTVRRRLGEVKLQITESLVGAARGALGAGDKGAAEEAYRRALNAAPEVGELRVELANLVVERGDLAGAIALLQADPVGDRQVLLRLAELLVESEQPQQGLDALRRILLRDPQDREAARRAVETRRAIELLRMPEEYRRIYATPRITRADLAALLSVKATALAHLAPGEAKVAIDISGSWARDHVLKILSLDIMDVYPNHTFQPGAIVRRGDLAHAVGRILALLKAPVPALGLPAIKDMSSSNLLYEGAARAVDAGLMDLTSDGAFEPWRPVSGPDAVAVVEALVRVVGP